MSIKAMTAAVALALAVSSPAFAQTSANSTTEKAATQQTTVNGSALQPGQIRASKMVGAKVYGPKNDEVASVKDVVLDHTGRVAAVVLDPGGGKYVAVPMDELQLQRTNDNSLRFATKMTQNQLKSAQAFDLNVRNVGSGSSTAPANGSKK